MACHGYITDGVSKGDSIPVVDIVLLLAIRLFIDHSASRIVHPTTKIRSPPIGRPVDGYMLQDLAGDEVFQLDPFHSFIRAF